ncbi:type II methionyl aminopeptidase [Candidatus Woesearchaeota archaeon]|nr:type II methionyl aminopeptidase [Candidatus Woesearchaeota archaeon]
MFTKYSDEEYANWRKASIIAAKAREYGRLLIKPGAKLLDVSEAVEDKIRKLGALPAFPAQISLNNTAAHNCADPNDTTILEDQVIKLDCGAHIGGAVADNAVCVDLSGKWSDLIKASREACLTASKVAGPGVCVTDVGREIDRVIASYGFRAVRNLCGHGLAPFTVHTYPTIPNFDSGDDEILEEGMVIAIEPFATPGTGLVQEIDKANIFMFQKKKPVRSPYAREVLGEIELFQGLPFTTRWLSSKFSAAKLTLGLRELLAAGVIRQYPPLTEVSKNVVSQYENSWLITANGCELLTKGDE